VTRNQHPLRTGDGLLLLEEEFRDYPAGPIFTDSKLLPPTTAEPTDEWDPGVTIGV
jgi:hypothetical protein